MITLPAGGGYGEGLRKTLVHKLGEDGAWLLLSMDHYGWRAVFDLMTSLIRGAEGMSAHHARHLQSLVDLQAQSGLYSVAEQFARLIKAITAHEDGTAAFFETYMQRYQSIPDLIAEVGTYTREQLNEWFAVPNDPAELAANSRVNGVPMDTETAAATLTRVTETLDELHANLKEIGQLTLSPNLTGTGAPVDQGHSLRNVDNAFRHGLKVLLHDTLPTDRTFGVAIQGRADPLSEWVIDLYQSDSEPKFATIDGRPERTEAHLHALEGLSVRIKQATRSFIVRLTGQPAALVTMTAIDPNDLDPSFADE